MCPLDGWTNIDVNVSVDRYFFSIFRRITPIGTPVELKDFLQPSNVQVVAGYIIYGTSNILVSVTGKDVITEF